jgi:hypothetical protein
MMLMYLQKVVSKKFEIRVFFAGILKVTDEKNRIRIHMSVTGSANPDPYPYQNVTVPQEWI